MGPAPDEIEMKSIDEPVEESGEEDVVESESESDPEPEVVQPTPAPSI